MVTTADSGTIEPVRAPALIALTTPNGAVAPMFGSVIVIVFVVVVVVAMLITL
jgi:hypothetical protein